MPWKSGHLSSSRPVSALSSTSPPAGAVTVENSPETYVRCPLVASWCGAKSNPAVPASGVEDGGAARAADGITSTSDTAARTTRLVSTRQSIPRRAALHTAHRQRGGRRRTDRSPRSSSGRRLRACTPEGNQLEKLGVERASPPGRRREREPCRRGRGGGQCRCATTVDGRRR